MKRKIFEKLVGANMLTIYPVSELYQEMEKGNWAQESEIGLPFYSKLLAMLRRKIYKITENIFPTYRRRYFEIYRQDMAATL